MPSNFSSLTVTWFDETDSYTTSSNITNDVKSIPLFTDTGTGEVNTASLIIRSLDGNYNVTAKGDLTISGVTKRITLEFKVYSAVP